MAEEKTLAPETLVEKETKKRIFSGVQPSGILTCLLYTSDAADEL